MNKRQKHHHKIRQAKNRKKRAVQTLDKLIEIHRSDINAFVSKLRYMIAPNKCCTSYRTHTGGGCYANQSQKSNEAT
jgi:hypothetical protein